MTWSRQLLFALAVTSLFPFGAIALYPLPSLSLPLPEDVPEEVLRTEIITEARSPLDGEPIGAANYALLEERLRTSPPNPQVNPEVEQLIYLIRLRKLFRSLGIPIK